MPRFPQRYRQSYTEEELAKLTLEVLRDWIKDCKAHETRADRPGMGRAKKARHLFHSERLKAEAELRRRLDH